MIDEKFRFYKGKPADIAQQLANLFNYSIPYNEGVNKPFDIAQQSAEHFDHRILHKRREGEEERWRVSKGILSDINLNDATLDRLTMLGVIVEGITEVYDISSIFDGILIEQGIVVGYQNRPNQSLIMPIHLHNCLISLDNLIYFDFKHVL